MRGLSLLLVAAWLLAGCSSSGGGDSVVTETGTIDFAGVDVEVSSTTGAIRGVVVDEAIRPIAEAEVAVTSGGMNKTAATDAAGRFAFSDLKPGTYFIRAQHLLYDSVQVSVEVQAGVEPAITKVQMKAKFDQKPFHHQFKFQGFIACGYQAVVVTAPCVTDYTTIACAGGCVPPAHDTLTGIQGDHRAINTTVEAQWQTMVLEMTWEPNGQGTSDEMGMLLSYYGRTASEWFGNTEGARPLLLRFEVGEKHPSSQGTERPMVEPEGAQDLMILASVKGENDVGVNVNQDFTIVQTNFYNAKPPEDWSFVRGDPMPF
jgi:hypothetical protein